MASIRLLYRTPNGKMAFRESTSGEAPSYAILSHTWGKEEVLFHDMNSDPAWSKAGWKKLEFCASQAEADGLKYFWVDTCCIDQKNANELAAAINSMFRWYQRAVRCYVYLPDVSIHSACKDGQTSPAWEAEFKKSRWFTRGWTLQELIAPAQVDFFSREGARLGNKRSLEEMIHQITGIERKALSGIELSTFTVVERMSWAENRQTTLEEDEIYSLFGIFNIKLPIIYGEGREHASRRLQDEMDKVHKGADCDQFFVPLDFFTLPQSAQFVARSKELAEMHQVLYGSSSRSIIVLQGLGGIGKTQLSITYAKQHEEKFSAIFWLNANDEISLRLSFRSIAQQILEHHPSTNPLANIDLDVSDRVVRAVKAWLGLQNNKRWLLIYDNYDNPKVSGSANSSAVDIRQFLPRYNRGSIIITTRSSQVTLGQRLRVEKLLDVQEGLEIVSKMSGRKDIQNDPDAIALVKALDGLPLALSTAGAYLEHVTTSFADYLRHYDESWLRLQKTSPRLDSYEDRSLYTTWQITFDRIEKRNPLSARLLRLWAYFDRRDLWFELLNGPTAASNGAIKPLFEDELDFNEAISVLSSFGLVDVNQSSDQESKSRSYSLHTCVHSWTRFVLNKEVDMCLLAIAMDCFAFQVCTPLDKNWWLSQKRILPHATHQERLVENVGQDTEYLHFFFSALGLLYSNEGKLTKAEQMYIRALQSYEVIFGKDYEATIKMETIWTLIAANNLGLVYFDQGKLVEAEQLYLRVLKSYEAAFGRPYDTATAWYDSGELYAINNLGKVYSGQGKLAEAEKLLTRALHGKEHLLGPLHEATLDTVDMLGNLYRDQRRLVEAERMFARALQGKEEVLPPGHTSTLDTIGYLGDLYLVQDKLLEAEKMFARALQGYEDDLGPELMSSSLPALDIMIGFGDVCSQTNRKDRAKELYAKALSGYTDAQGPSSKRCRELQDRLRALHLAPADGKPERVPKLSMTDIYRARSHILRPPHRSETL